MEMLREHHQELVWEIRQHHLDTADRRVELMSVTCEDYSGGNEDLINIWSFSFQVQAATLIGESSKAMSLPATVVAVHSSFPLYLTVKGKRNPFLARCR
jgi:hypothetical protein